MELVGEGMRKPTYLLLLDSDQPLQLGKYQFALGNDRVSFDLSRFGDGTDNAYTITSLYSPEVLKGLMKMWVADKAPGCAYMLQRVLDCGTIKK